MREIIPNVLWIGNAFDARNVKAVMDAGFQVAVVAQVESIDFDDSIRRVTSTGPCDMSPNLYAAVKQLLP